jgi:hypothetical protein
MDEEEEDMVEGQRIAPLGQRRGRRGEWACLRRQKGVESPVSESLLFEREEEKEVSPVRGLREISRPNVYRLVFDATIFSGSAALLWIARKQKIVPAGFARSARRGRVIGWAKEP